MGEERCRVVATRTLDLRCNDLLSGREFQVEDSRYRKMEPLVEFEVEDSRCNSVSIAFEDPRCYGLVSKW